MMERFDAIQACPKVWGTTTPLLITPISQTHYIRATPGYRCSRHKHATKWNRFYVICGYLNVVIYEDDGETIRMTARLTGGDTIDVPPGVLHRFESPAYQTRATEAIEVYWADNHGPVAEDDIQRIDEGGKL